MRRFVVGVMGPGEGAEVSAEAAARRLGRLIAEQGWVLLTGGRNAGVMRAANAGAKEVPGSLTVGLLPDAHAEPSPDVDLVIPTGLGNARNNLNVLASDVIVAVGRGGPGTVSEVALALKAGKPVLLLGADPLSLAFFGQLSAGRAIALQTPEAVIAEIRKICAARSSP